MLAVVYLEYRSIPHDQIHPFMTLLSEHLKRGPEHGTASREERIEVKPFVCLTRVATLGTTDEGGYVPVEGEMAGVGHTAPKYMPNRHLVFGGEGVAHEADEGMCAWYDVGAWRRGRAFVPSEFPAAMAHDILYALADLGGSMRTGLAGENMPIDPHIGVFGDKDHGAATVDTDDVDGASQLELLVPTQIDAPGFFEGGYHARCIRGRVDATAKGGMHRFAL